MPEYETRDIETSLAGQEVHTGHAELKISGTDCLDIRQTSPGYPIGKDDETSAKNIGAVFALPLLSGQKVYCQDGYVGKIISLRIDHQATVKNFAVQTGRFIPRKWIVPFEWVDRVEGESVFLSAKKNEITNLPESRPDSNLVKDVELAVWEDGLLHGINYNRIDISAHCGVIVLEGYVSNSVLKARIEEVARYVPGVLGIINKLVVDVDLKIAAALEVTRELYHYEGRIFIVSHNGFIILRGEVSSEEARMAAEERAGDVQNIRGVLNSLRVLGSNITVKEQRALQPVIGAKVHATSAAFGFVQQVVINPINRLVVAMIVDGQFPDPQAMRKCWFLHKSAMLHRKVVIPVRAIANETDTAVFLVISGTEASMMDDFNPQFFSVPDTGWHPPYPYQREQVLIMRM